MPFTVSPLRYPGGKSAISSFLAQVIRLNGAWGGTYIEPYAGGAGAALALLFQGAASRVIINDYDPVIYSFWHAILNDTDRFVEKVNSAALDMNEWNNQKSILKSAALNSVFDVGFAAFYLNRCNRSGILMAGPIGGKHQTGSYTLSARYKRQVLSAKIKRIAEQRDNIEVYNLDAIQFLHDVAVPISEPKLIYLDPPYYEKGKLLYLNAYTHEDHENLAWALGKMDKPNHWILTYDNAPEIVALYRSSSTSTYTLNYSAHHARKAKELLIAPHNLSVPSQGEIRHC